MNLLIGLALLAVLAIPFVLALYRSNELFVLEVTAGRVRFVRGRMPQRLLDDLTDVLARPPVADARVRVITEDRRPRVLVMRGSVSPGQLQAMRNVLGSWQVPQIRAGGKPARR